MRDTRTTDGPPRQHQTSWSMLGALAVDVLASALLRSRWGMLLSLDT